jgi:hypothetical protein
MGDSRGLYEGTGKSRHTWLKIVKTVLEAVEERRGLDERM